jgi:hypothetical protein
MLLVLLKIRGIPWLALRVSEHEHGLWHYSSLHQLGLGLLIVEFSKSHSATRNSVGILCVTDRLVAETSSRQQARVERDRYPCRPLKFEPAADPRFRPRGHRALRLFRVYKYYERHMTITEPLTGSYTDYISQSALLQQFLKRDFPLL